MPDLSNQWDQIEKDLQTLITNTGYKLPREQFHQLKWVIIHTLTARANPSELIDNTELVHIQV